MSDYSYNDFCSSVESIKEEKNLKVNLMNLLKEKGVVNRLKTQVRQNLISEMAAKESIFNMKKSKIIGKVDEIDIFQHASVSVIAEYFSKENLPYSLSVFIPETGLSADKFYGIQEILRILQIDSESEFCQKLKSLLSNANKGFLWCIMKAVSEYHATTRKEIHIQTEKAERYIPISEKMQKLDLQFGIRQKEGILKSQQVFEDRMISYQTELEKRLRQEMDNEIQRFKTHEISMLKMKDEEKLSKLIKQKSKMLEEEYQNRLTALKERERTSQENIQRLLESQERENYLQRQQLIRDINNIRERELNNKKEKDRMDREFEMMKDQHKVNLNDMEKRSAKLRDDEVGYELKIQKELNNIRLNEESRLVHKWKEIEVIQAKLKEDQNYLLSEKEMTEKIKEELLRKQLLFKEMEIISYPTLKEQNQTLQDQIKELKQQLEQQILINGQDKHKIDCLIKQKLGPNFEQQVLSNELDRARDVFKREKMLLEEQKEGLEKKLLEEIRQKRLLTDQYSQQQELLESLTRQLGEMKDLSYRSRHGYQSNRSQGNTFYSARRSPTRDVSPHYSPDSRRRLHFDENDNEDNKATCDLDDFSSDAKHRLLCLDEETEQINKTYQLFKNRLMNPITNIEEKNLSLPTNLVSESFTNGLKVGRKLNIKDIDDFETPVFLTRSPEIHTKNESNDYLSHVNITDAQNVERNTNVSAILNPSAIQRFSPQLSKSENSDKDFYNNVDIDVNNDDVTKDIKNSIYFDRNDDLKTTDSEESNIINLNEDWKSGKDRTSSPPLNVPNNVLVTNVEDDPEIDPVVKQYMELVRKKKEADQIKEKEVFIAPIQTINADGDISEDIKTESQYSADGLSDKKENSGHSETDSFW